MNQLANAMWVGNGKRHKGLSPKLIPYRDYSQFDTTENGMFAAWHETLNNIFIGGCSGICEEVASQKLGQAYRKATGLSSMVLHQTMRSTHISTHGHLTMIS